MGLLTKMIWERLSIHLVIIHIKWRRWFYLQIIFIKGRMYPDEQLQSMLSEAPGPLNFTMFLSIFGERVAGLYWKIL